MQRNDFILVVGLSGAALLAGISPLLASRNGNVTQLPYQAHVRHSIWGLGNSPVPDVPLWIKRLEWHRFLSNGYDLSADVLEHCKVETHNSALALQWTRDNIWVNGKTWSFSERELRLPCNRDENGVAFYLIHLQAGATYTIEEKNEYCAILLEGRARIDSTSLTKGDCMLVEGTTANQIKAYQRTNLLLTVNHDE